jgi:hypothetical protein
MEEPDSIKIRLADICREIHPKAVEELHRIAKQIGMKNYKHLNKVDLCHMLSTHMGMQIAAEHIRGSRFSEIMHSDGDTEFNEYMARKAPDVIDPITKIIMIEPVLVSSGVHYDRASITAWIKLHGKHRCPETKQNLEPIAYADPAMRKRIADLLSRYGVEMDIQLDQPDLTKVQLWTTVPQKTVKKTGLFFNYAMGKKLAKPKYLNNWTVFSPRGWRLLWCIVSANMKFNNTLEHEADKGEHEEKWKVGTRDILNKTSLRSERSSYYFNDNLAKLIRTVEKGIRYFAMLTKYMTDNYVVDAGEAALSAPVMHVFYVNLGFSGMHELDGYEQYQNSALWRKGAGFYATKIITENTVGYFDSHPLLV